MSSPQSVMAFSVSALLLASSPATGQQRERSQVPLRVRKEFSRLYSYAQMKSDQDTRDAKYRAMTQEMQQLGATFAARTAWLEPEVLGMDRGRVEESLKVEPKLGPYRMYLGDILRRQPHTLGESEERILANAAPTRRARRTTCTRSCCSTTTAATRT